MNRVRVGAEKLEHFCVMPASNVDGTSVIPTAPHETISIPCMIVHAPRRPLCLCCPHDSIPRSFAQSHHPASLVSHEPFCLPLAMTCQRPRTPISNADHEMYKMDPRCRQDGNGGQSAGIALSSRPACSPSLQAFWQWPAQRPDIVVKPATAAMAVLPQYR